MERQAVWAGQVELAQLSDCWSYLRLMSEPARREMEDSLRQHGQLSPLVCARPVEHEPQVVVVDGFKRLRAARSLGWSALRVEVHPAQGASAKLWIWQSNQASGLSELEQAWLVRSLYREEHLTQPQIARLLRRHKSWVCRRLMLAEGLAEGVEADVRLGLLSATLAREIGRLPRGNQEQAAQVVSRRGLTTRQTARLVDQLLLSPDDGLRQTLLAQALEGEGVAGAEEGPQRKRRLTPGEWLMADVAALKRVSTRLHARLLQRPLLSLGAEAASLALRNLEELGPGLLCLCQTIDKLREEVVADVALC